MTTTAAMLEDVIAATEGLPDVMRDSGDRRHPYVTILLETARQHSDRLTDDERSYVAITLLTVAAQYGYDTGRRVSHALPINEHPQKMPFPPDEHLEAQTQRLREEATRYSFLLGIANPVC